MTYSSYVHHGRQYITSSLLVQLTGRLVGLTLIIICEALEQAKLRQWSEYIREQGHHEKIDAIALVCLLSKWGRHSGRISRRLWPTVSWRVRSASRSR